MGETAELTFTVRIQTLDIGTLGVSESSLKKSRAWVDFYRTNIQGSYSEAKHTVLIPLKEVVVSGETTWEGNALFGYIELHSRIQLPQEGLWKIEGCFSGEGWK